MLTWLGPKKSRECSPEDKPGDGSCDRVHSARHTVIQACDLRVQLSRWSGLLGFPMLPCLVPLDLLQQRVGWRGWDVGRALPFCTPLPAGSCRGGESIGLVPGPWTLVGAVPQELSWGSRFPHPALDPALPSFLSSFS